MLIWHEDKKVMSSDAELLESNFLIILLRARNFWTALVIKNVVCVWQGQRLIPIIDVTNDTANSAACIIIDSHEQFMVMIVIHLESIKSYLEVIE